ncbi:hypothetical protein BGZ63DRAFT_372123 [Mariannaea sp. PMI_226]|nr:hypothetical protein BGZ63DRAFT_372123 [Mariannaea sp. PMI_226]
MTNGYSWEVFSSVLTLLHCCPAKTQVDGVRLVWAHRTSGDGPRGEQWTGEFEAKIGYRFGLAGGSGLMRDAAAWRKWLTGEGKMDQIGEWEGIPIRKCMVRAPRAWCCSVERDQE